jgi:hypothetical protein
LSSDPMLLRLSPRTIAMRLSRRQFTRKDQAVCDGMLPIHHA